MKIKKKYFLAVTFAIVFLASIVPAYGVHAKSRISNTNLTLSVGQSKMLKVYNTAKKVTWSASPQSVVQVSSRGEVFAVGRGTGYVAARFGSKKYTCKVFVYKAASGNSTLDGKIRYIISKKITSDMSTVEKIRVIHDYILLNCEYGYNSKNPMDSHTAAGVLVYKKAVCQGYALAFQLFMDALGIPCKTVYGMGYTSKDSAGHGWNMVNVGGNWYHIDVTWDDPGVKCRVYDYFLLSDKEMNSRASKHTWKSSDYPRCTAKSKNRFVDAFGTVSKTESEAASSLKKQYKKKKPEYVLVVPTSVYSTNFLYSSLYGMCEKIGKKFKKGHYSIAEYGKYFIVYITLKF